MDKNTTIAFVLIGAILIIWLFLNTPEQEKQTPGTSDTTKVIDQKPEELPKTQSEEKTRQRQQNTTVEDSSLGRFSNAFTDTGRIITVETDLAIYEISTRGANFHKIYLKKFNNWYSTEDNSNNFYKKSVQLINYSLENAYNISFVSTEGKAINTSTLNFKTTSQSKLTVSGNDSLIINFRMELNTSGAIEKKYIFNAGSYLIGSEITFEDFNGIITDNVYDISWESGLRSVERNSVNEAGFSSADVYYGDEKVVVDAPGDGEKITKDFNGKVDWLAVRNKYFTAIMIPSDPSQVEGAYIEGQTFPTKSLGLREIYNVHLVMPFSGNKLEKRSVSIYVGPVDYDLLKEINTNLTALVDFGTFFGLKFIVRPIAEYLLLPLFKFLNDFIPNYGFVIIVFSLIIKIIVYPLTRKSFQSMKKMQLLQPKITELKEKFKDDPQAINKETMKLYSTYGVNPAGGCLPILLQMPIFIALWGLFQAAIELRQQPFIFWINDLSVPDVIFDLGFKLPLFGVREISGLALLMGITTFVQQKMSIKDPKQQALVYMMPVMLTILFMTFPSGLNLYYFMFNLFSIAQQYYINQKKDNVELVPVDPSKRKKGFMQRLTEAAEQQSKQQQRNRK
ncbi:MAG: membrane protein insertase YidC [Ignavibacteriota bacterium]|nr:membrane protein insertase YidC [Ignavibacteriota bacterium]QKJ95862.1 MAG: membrane protein insertase YidC [Ignavibacteriota bacterium]GIK59360.1 MAG: membrane protein insertase YidC [Ignavibacteriota bacterium]